VGALGRRPAGGPPPERPTIVLVLEAPTTFAQIEALCERVPGLVDDCSSDPACDVAAVADPDAGTVDALARLQLAAVRQGRRLRFLNACGELQGLLRLTGLGDVLPCEDVPCGPPPGDASGIEAVRKAEQREHAQRVEEERDARDPSA
jgi:hypothetical protein